MAGIVYLIGAGPVLKDGHTIDGPGGILFRAKQFEEGKVAYDQRDAAGFIKLNALRLRLLGRRDR